MDWAVFFLFACICWCAYLNYRDRRRDEQYEREWREGQQREEQQREGD